MSTITDTTTTTTTTLATPLTLPNGATSRTAGKGPDPTYGPRRAVLHALKRDARNILRRRRGI